MVFCSARLWFSVALTLTALPSLSFAMRIDYIATVMPDCCRWTEAMRVLRDDIEVKVSDAALGALTRKDRDSIQRLLQKTYGSLPSGNNTELPLSAIVLKSLMLLSMGETGRPAAFDQALALLSASAKQYPRCPQTAWIRGMLLLKRGSLFDGIRVLDSLRISGFNDEEFLSDYARVFFYTVIPHKADTLTLLLRDPVSTRRADTASPQVFGWKIVTSQKAALPFFEYEAAFAFRKQFTLQFNGLRPCNPGAALLRYGSIEPQSTASTKLLGQLSERIDSAWCAIHIDVNDVTVSPFEYLRKRISGIYDSIAEKSDLPQYNAVSLRCYTVGIWGREGTRTAYVVFDRAVMDIMRSSSPRRRLGGREAGRKIRFTVTMRSGIDVEAQAEAKLQTIIRAF